jgi:hypothetical protein
MPLKGLECQVPQSVDSDACRAPRQVAALPADADGTLGSAQLAGVIRGQQVRRGAVSEKYIFSASRI